MHFCKQFTLYLIIIILLKNRYSILLSKTNNRVQHTNDTNKLILFMLCLYYDWETFVHKLRFSLYVDSESYKIINKSITV